MDYNGVVDCNHLLGVMSSLFDKLDAMEARYRELADLLAQPEIAVDYERVQTLAKESARLEDTVNLHRELRKLRDRQEEAQAIVDAGDDSELVALAREEMDVLAQQVEPLEDQLRLAVLPKDPNDERNVIVEIRKGAGGQEAGLFAGDLFRLYSRYAQIRGWQVDVLNSNPSDLGGYNEIVFAVKGKDAFSRLKSERGVHRVQRIPTTESSGRLHTSTATVAVLPEAEEVDIKINLDDLRIDVFHAGGHGGQNVNKVATAIRIVHNPTGIVVTCQDERSQYKNKQRALNILRARLYEQEQQRQEKEIIQSRRTQVGTGDRAEKIRTYNFPQDRITDHRIGQSFYGIQKFMDGFIDDIIDALAAHEQARSLEEALTG